MEEVQEEALALEVDSEVVPALEVDSEVVLALEVDLEVALEVVSLVALELVLETILEVISTVNEFLKQLYFIAPITRPGLIIFNDSENLSIFSKF